MWVCACAWIWEVSFFDPTSPNSLFNSKRVFFHLVPGDGFEFGNLKQILGFKIILLNERWASKCWRKNEIQYTDRCSTVFQATKRFNLRTSNVLFAWKMVIYSSCMESLLGSGSKNASYLSKGDMCHVKMDKIKNCITAVLKELIILYISSFGGSCRNQ